MSLETLARAAPLVPHARSYRNPLDLVESDSVAGPIRAFARGHGLGVFQSASGFEIGRDPGRAECVATDLHFRPQFGAALNHAPCIDPVHRLFGQRPRPPDGGAEEGTFRLITDPGLLYIGVEMPLSR
jgi:hypothetical protein